MSRGIVVDKYWLFVVESLVNFPHSALITVRTDTVVSLGEEDVPLHKKQPFIGVVLWTSTNAVHTELTFNHK